MESEDNVSGEFQRSTRMPLDAVVRLHFQGTVAYQNGFAANVSATGMFVKHPAPPPLGTQLVFEFNLGAERKPVQGGGEVVWVREKYLGPGQPAGVGIRFLQLDSQSRDHIAEALFEYLEQSLTEDSLLDSSGFSFETESVRVSTQPTIAPVPATPPRTPAPGDHDGLADDGDIYGEPADVLPPAQAPPAEPYAFAALERLPNRSPSPTPAMAPVALTAPVAPMAPMAPTAPITPADSKRAFSVFSPLDEADPQTATIVREALKDEPPLLLMGAAAAASSRRDGSRAWLGLLFVLALVAGGGYLAWKQWGANGLTQRSATASTAPAPTPAPAPVRKPEPLNAAPAPGTTLAEAIGVDSGSTSAAAAPPHSAPSSAPPEEPSDVGAAQQESAEAAGAAAEQPTAAEAPRPPTTPAPEATEVPVAPAATAARAERLTGIEWREASEAPGETVLVLAGDGVFATGSFSYSEIGGENPRVLIKLKGMDNPYRGPEPRGGSLLVRGVRTGFHVTPAGNEIHIVVDLSRGGIKVLSLEPQGAGLTLRLGR
ncbi:MAG: PilZ domain-containing protein [Thermoanaerobaculia bacterium]